MKIEFGSNRLRKQMSNATEIKKAFGHMAKRVSARLDEIQSSDNLATLQQIVAANCHPLNGNRNGDWAVDITGNYRMIFVIDQNPVPIKEDNGIDTILVTDIRITGTEDYH